MKFMLIRRADANTENGAMPSQEMLADMAAYNQRMPKRSVAMPNPGDQKVASNGMIIFPPSAS